MGGNFAENIEADTAVREPVEETVMGGPGAGRREVFAMDGKVIWLDNDRDAILSDSGRDTLVDRYLMKGESFQRMFARVACAGADDSAHAQRLYDYISRLWFMPATPVLTNLGTKRGNPISCFLNSVDDSLDGIVSTWNENVWLAARGGGIGTYWGLVREVGSPAGENGATSGIMPFIKVMDSQTLAISQGGIRRGSAAVYLPIWHPEIEEFVEIRRTTGGDVNRKALNLHNAVVIDDAFMRAVANGGQYDLRSPLGNPVRRVDARALWIKILTARAETGEPYILFSDTVQRAIPEHHKGLGLTVLQSNLCTEILLPTGKDYAGSSRSAVCCLSSLNMEIYDEWRGRMDQLVYDVMRFLDNVLETFIRITYGVKGFERSNYSARMERSVGLGIMGFHGYLQQKMVPFESVMAQQINKTFFIRLRQQCDDSNRRLAGERGACPDSINAGQGDRRFSYMMAIAPTASISIIANDSSPGIEPLSANAFTQKTLTGSLMIQNKYLGQLLRAKGRDTKEVWSSITVNGGSVQHLDFLDEFEKDVFKTFLEIDQGWVIQHAADRTPYIDQGQSVNISVRPNISKKELHQLHFDAWQKGLKTLYYCRSESVGSADKVSERVERNHMDSTEAEEPAKYETCEACQ